MGSTETQGTITAEHNGQKETFNISGINSTVEKTLQLNNDGYVNIKVEYTEQTKTVPVKEKRKKVRDRRTTRRIKTTILPPAITETQIKAQVAGGTIPTLRCIICGTNIKSNRNSGKCAKCLKPRRTTTKNRRDLGESIECPKCQQWYLEHTIHQCIKELPKELIEHCMKCGKEISFRDYLAYDKKCMDCKNAKEILTVGT